MFTIPQTEGLDDETPLTVVFRRWLEDATIETDQHGTEAPAYRRGDVIALFPFVENAVLGKQQECMSYQHVGQHSGAHYAHVIAKTLPIDTEDPADLADQTALFEELSRIGYDMDIMTHEGVCHEVGYQRGLSEGREEGVARVLALP